MNLVPYYDLPSDTYYIRTWSRDCGQKFMAFYPVEKELYDQIKEIHDKAESDLEAYFFNQDPDSFTGLELDV